MSSCVSTNIPTSPVQFTGATTQSRWRLDLIPGPYWNSFEQLRVAGSSALDGIEPNSVATVSTKCGVYRILRDGDYQRLLGLAADVHRIKSGITFILSAARFVQKHKDEESINLLIQSVDMLGGSCALPERDGHGEFEITPEEAAENTDDFDITAIRRPSW